MTPARQMLAPLDVQMMTPAALPPVSRVVFAAASVIMKWELRHRTRRTLVSLTDHQLRDIGLEHGAALTEARRWFWQA
ncbi:DUF1127 domain-containing protein [Thalassobium sp. R2A62]|uniref:DUF1127 domain-containing protein n=1 Tax=Thalassobium sp. R2A62 TaxID=633131 RepID=UPI0001B1D2ED|nr:DUF1127 domain-containing protein [Thalassobium sp. R2A62]EET49450.1 hypothetical protein TR2A62_0752 [Thalassobium sp. R2A62]MDG1339856.1 DUF1127 domain-containing protein [Paracoccaceae bacterium]